MAWFITRVEIHGGSGSDYDALHEAMGRAGFSRTIKFAPTEQEFHLPDAEYFITGNYSVDQILSKAKTAATLVKKSFAVLVTQGSGGGSYNLKPFLPAPPPPPPPPARRTPPRKP